MKNIFTTLILITLLLISALLKAEDGYRLWLRYDLINDPLVLSQYNKSISGFMIEGSSPTLKAAGNELQIGLNGLLGRGIHPVTSIKKDGTIVAGTAQSSPLIASLNIK